LHAALRQQRRRAGVSGHEPRGITGYLLVVAHGFEMKMLAGLAHEGFNRLKAAGKLYKVMIAAVMRKIIAINAMVLTTLFGPTIFAAGTLCRPLIATALIDLVGSRP
jgi:hypothetical protein